LPDICLLARTRCDAIGGDVNVGDALAQIQGFVMVSGSESGWLWVWVLLLR